MIEHSHGGKLNLLVKKPHLDVEVDFNLHECMISWRKVNAHNWVAGKL